ncbi:MAG TPA: hypothetical protein PKO47_16095, partial [bacterium]|nr:hypothetical protein [bacterium]
EDIFGLVRRAEIKVSPENFDVIYEGVDIISQIIELISNEGSDDSIDISVIVKKLEAIYNPQEVQTSALESKEVSKSDVEPVIDVVSKAQSAPVSDAKNPESEETEFKPTTDVSKSEVIVDKTDASKANVSEDAFIRVPTRRLDDLMNQVSELVTTRIKSQQRLADIRKMLDFTEEWAQQTERIRLLLDRTLSRIVNEDVERPSDVKSELITSYDLRTVVTSYLSSIEKIGSIAESISILYDKQSEENLRMSVITGDIQDNLRIIRLLPISTIFDLYPRMIRDIAKLQSKKVKFEVFGGDTRVDKKVLEELKDPLIHLLRNSIDHGIEAPADREASGKTQEGTIQIRAGYVG